MCYIFISNSSDQEYFKLGESSVVVHVGGPVPFVHAAQLTGVCAPFLPDVDAHVAVLSCQTPVSDVDALEGDNVEISRSNVWKLVRRSKLVNASFWGLQDTDFSHALAQQRPVEQISDIPVPQTF